MRYLFVLTGLLVLTSCADLSLINDATNAPQQEIPVLSDDTGHEIEQISDSDNLDTEAIPQPETDLWAKLRLNFSLPESQQKRIQSQFDWYVRHPEYMQRVAERAKPYLYFVMETVEEGNIPMEIALLPIVESAFLPFAYSHGRAAGMWQFIPATGKRFGLKQNWWYDGRRDVYASTYAAVELMQVLGEQFNGDWLLALAAYNSGSGTVRRAIRKNRRLGKPTDFWSLSLPNETRAYVPKLLALKRLIANPELYGLELKPIPDEPYLARAKLDSQIDLARAAELAEIPLDELYKLNPGYNRWATAPDGPHDLFIPKTSVDVFAQNLSKLPPEKRIRWIRHKIAKGETLSTIATKYNTSIATIKQYNKIRGTQLRAGHSLTIPVASKASRHYRLSASQRTRTKQNTPRKGTKVVYIVKSGDTFWDLARKHKVQVRALAQWNSMAPRDPLRPGQRLIIWYNNLTASHSEPLDVSQLMPPQQRNVTKRIGYRVKSGDSLAKISRKFRVSISQLRRWNHLPKNKYLQPGQRLTLYIDVMSQTS